MPTTLTFDNESPQTLSGSGQIVFAGNAPTNNTLFVDDSMGSLTVQPSIVITGTSGTIQASGTGGNLILQGVISANNIGGTIVVQGPNILYQGTMQCPLTAPSTALTAISRRLTPDRSTF